jgi:hypothetical protein
MAGAPFGELLLAAHRIEFSPHVCCAETGPRKKAKISVNFPTSNPRT